MAMREPVAMDFMGVEPAVGSNGSRRSPDAAAAGSSESGRLVRPIPNGSHARRSPEAASGTTHPFASSGNNLHGLRKQPWNRRFQGEEDHCGGMAVVSPKRERASPEALPHAQAHHPSDNSAPASPSHHKPGEFWRMQQPPASKVQHPMYASHQQPASRQQAGAQRTSPMRDEASQRGAQPGLEHPPQPPSNQGAFGSPTPFHFQANGAAAAAAAMANKRSPFQNHPFQTGIPPGHAVARLAPGGGKQQPSTAQLTIFYAGMVNVYDYVPFDKAQAIMLLAGSGNSWSSNYTDPPVANGAAARRNPFLKTPMSVPQSTPSTPGSPMASPQAPTTAGQPPRSGVVFSNIRQPPITNVELPQARKASLARFLEKRKDRVRKAPVSEEGEAASASRDKSPGPAPAVGKPDARSPSPAPAAQDQHRGSESSSPPTKPPGTPPRQTTLDSQTRSPTPKRRDTADPAMLHQSKSNKRARSGRSPHRTPDPDDSSSL